MSIWLQPFTLEDLSQSRKDTLVDHLGIEFIEIGEDYLSARMPVDIRTRQFMGIMHGGASCVLAETVASVASGFCIDKETKICVGLEINTSHLKMVHSGFVVGKAMPLHLGQTTHLWEIMIVDDKNQLISANRLRLAILDKR